LKGFQSHLLDYRQNITVITVNKQNILSFS